MKDIFSKIMDRFKFTEPVPENIRNLILSGKEVSLKSVLTQFGDYSFYYGMVLKVYYKANRMGMGISIGMSKFLVIFISMGIIVLSGVVVYLNADLHLNAEQTVNAEKKMNAEQTVNAEKKMNAEQTVNAENEGGLRESAFIKFTPDIPKKTEVRYALGVKTFKSKAVDSKTLNKITSNITSNLIKIKGKKQIINLRNRNGKNVNYMLLGSVEKLGTMIIITGKIVDVGKSKIVFTFSDIASSIDDVGNACKRVAQKVAGEIKK